MVEAADFVSADPDLSGTMTVTWTVDDHETAFASTLADLDDFVSS